MSKTKAQRRANKRRRYVNRNDRVKPSPLAEAKKRPWPMAQLLHKGDISAEQFEAGVEIVAGFDALTQLLGYRPAYITDHHTLAPFTEVMNSAQARWATIYVRYANELYSRMQCRARDVVEVFRDDKRLLPDQLPAFTSALELWHDHRDDWDPRLTALQAGALHSSLKIPYRPNPPPAGAAVSLPSQSQSRHAAAPSPAPRAMVPRTR